MWEEIVRKFLVPAILCDLPRQQFPCWFPPAKSRRRRIPVLLLSRSLLCDLQVLLARSIGAGFVRAHDLRRVMQWFGTHGSGEHPFRRGVLTRKFRGEFSAMQYDDAVAEREELRHF